MKKISTLIFLFLMASSLTHAASSPQKKESAAEVNAHQQAYEGAVKALEKSLKTTDINKKNERGETILMSAAGNGQVESLKLILAKKPDLNLKDNNGNTALNYAIVNENTETAKMLIEAGAELTEINADQENALILATSANDEILMNQLITKDKSLVNKASRKGKTALMESAKYGNEKTIKILLDAGADKKAKNAKGQTAFDIAKKSRNDSVLGLLKN